MCLKDKLPALQITSVKFVTLVSVSTPLFKQQGRKHGEENCRSEVRGDMTWGLDSTWGLDMTGDMANREIWLAKTKQKQGDFFVETPST